VLLPAPLDWGPSVPSSSGGTASVIGVICVTGQVAAARRPGAGFLAPWEAIWGFGKQARGRLGVLPVNALLNAIDAYKRLCADLTSGKTPAARRRIRRIGAPQAVPCLPIRTDNAVATALQAEWPMSATGVSFASLSDASTNHRNALAGPREQQRLLNATGGIDPPTEVTRSGCSVRKVVGEPPCFLVCETVAQWNKDNSARGLLLYGLNSGPG
jgi:hypothetical protein